MLLGDRNDQMIKEAHSGIFRWFALLISSAVIRHSGSKFTQVKSELS